MGEGLERTLQGLQRQLSPPTLTFVIISDYVEEEQVGRRSTKNLKKKMGHTCCTYQGMFQIHDEVQGKGIGGGRQFTYQSNLEVSTC
jgi:hypothetical protein